MINQRHWLKASVFGLCKEVKCVVLLKKFKGLLEILLCTIHILS
jgi:hypothetical protein